MKLQAVNKKQSTEQTFENVLYFIFIFCYNQIKNQNTNEKIVTMKGLNSYRK